MESIRCLTPEDRAATVPIVALATLQECEFACSGLAYADFPYFLTILVAYHSVFADPLSLEVDPEFRQVAE